MEEKELSASDLTQQLGVSKGYISQLLNRQKTLTASVMRSFHKHPGIQADVLLS